MPYAPGQPWDETYSYSPGDTCTYRGLPYVWYHPYLYSTIGSPPNQEEVLFTAFIPGGGTDQRLERGWVLADDVVYYGGGSVQARYGNVRELQRSVRSIGSNIDVLNQQPELKYEAGIYPGFWTLQVNNKWSESWDFYGYARMSLDSGLANNDVSPPVPETDGNPNVTALGYFELTTYGPDISNPPSLPYMTVVPTGPTTADLKVYYTITETQLYAPTFINEFDRDAAYKIVVTPPTGPVTEITGSINSGPFRDGFSLESTSNVNTHPVAAGTGYTYAFSVTSLTPRFDA